MAPAAAQTGTIQGRVLEDETGAPLPGAYVHVAGTGWGAVTETDGRYVIGGVAPGTVRLVAEHLGRATAQRSVSVAAGARVEVDFRLAAQALSVAEVVVSATREAQSLAQTPAAVGVVGRDAIAEARPSHPSELLGQVPGVWVNVTGGEGHMTAIRQPLTTDPVYLYLEDGVPTRSTGFFNHNALYEINLPQADRVEVVKGPATALYGSDAIGGTINVETRPGRAAPGLDAMVEGGSHGWLRALGSYGWGGERTGLRLDVNLTTTDGWRTGTAYDRQSGTARWDRVLGEGSSLKTVLAFSRIDQQTAGSSRLPEAAYLASPTANLTPVSFREVGAVRLSTEYARAGERSLISVTPFARWNSMDILPNWSLTYDPAVWETSNASAGVLAKYRRDVDLWDARLIAGLDLDWSPGEHRERVVAPTRVDGVFTAYTPGAPIYDYGVTFAGVSPYVHAEASPLPRLRVTAGLRFDHLSYDYDNRLGELQTGPHRRPASTSVSFTELSPKLGATLDLGGGASVYAAYGHGFRAPSEGQLFRQGVALNTVGLEPVKADNLEAGVRGAVGGRFSYSLAAYRMVKHDDILTFQRPDDNRETQNAGETLHRGVEVGLGFAPVDPLVLRAALSWARHTYEAWRPSPGLDLSGMEMENAPRTIGNASATWTPLPGVSLGAEWVHLGAYWLDAADTQEYEGHDLLNLRGSWDLLDQTTLFARLSNATDEVYAESGGWSAFRGREFAPGLPRTLYAGVQLRLGGRP